MKKQDRIPYRTYTLQEFFFMAKRGIWPGANVQGFGFVGQGEEIPPAVRNVLDYGNEVDLLGVANEATGDLSLISGVLEHGNYGAIRLSKAGLFSPQYYPYKTSVKGGWRGGGPMRIQTKQVSGARGVAAYTGKGLFWVSTTLNIFIAGEAISYGKSDSYDVAMKSGFDILFGAIGTWGGSPGFVIAGLYFVISSSSRGTGFHRSEGDRGFYNVQDNTRVHNATMERDAAIKEAEALKWRKMEEERIKNIPVFKNRPK